MVRVLSCHHFQGQRIGRCDEAVGVAVAGDVIIVGLDNQISVYGDIGRSQEQQNTPTLSPASPPPPLPGPGSVQQHLLSASNQIHALHKNTAIEVPEEEFHPKQSHRSSHVLGTPFRFSKQTVHPRTPTVSKGSSHKDTSDLDNDLTLLHSFSTIDMIDKISYNEKGTYILCLEKREASSHNSTTIVRAYFHWEVDHGGKMRARIAGLVSPTGTEPEEECLSMVEIPLTSPATAVASCNLTGNMACLSAESIINIFLFRTKEVTGRMKVHYYDFDRTYAVELPGFVPESIYFLTNYLACLNSQSVRIINIMKDDGHKDEADSVHFKDHHHTAQQGQPTQKVVFDPKNESIRVYLPSITRANRRRKAPNGTILEEYEDDITSQHTKVIFTVHTPGIRAEDVLRVGVTNGSSGSKIKLLDMYPIRIKQDLGGIALMICTSKEGFLYHLSTHHGCSTRRVALYTFTSPLIGFGFDSLFFHAVTETGLETYTSRSLYHAAKDTEGFSVYQNDCPLQEEVPSLVGIRPFVGIKHMSCSSRNLCLACSPTTGPSRPTSASAPAEELAWTVYSLTFPNIEVICDDIIRAAQTQVDTNPESGLVLAGEAFIICKSYLNSHPEETVLFPKFKEICKILGLELIKSSVLKSNTETAVDTASSSTLSKVLSANTTSDVSEESLAVSQDVVENVNHIIDQGITFLFMGEHTLQELFSPENWYLMKDSRYVPGLKKLIEVAFLKSDTPQTTKLSPTLAPVVVEFLANNGPQVLVDIVLISSPFIRECNSRRLLTTLQHLAEEKGYPPKESLAVLLTLATIGGVDLNTRHQMNDVLQKTKLSEMLNLLSVDILFDGHQQTYYLNDLTICLLASDQHALVEEKIALLLRTNAISLTIVMTAFAQALTANTDNILQHSLSTALVSIIEKNVTEKARNSAQHVFSEDDVRAVKLLTRTYISNINFSSISHTDQSKQPETFGEGSLPTGTSHGADVQDKNPQEILRKNQIFGNVCNCVNYLLSVDTPGGMLTPQSQAIGSMPIFFNEESRENFIKLLSVLSNPQLSNMEGLKDIVLTYLYKNATQAKPTVNSTLYFILQVMAEIPENAINILLLRQPTTMMLFAKETFQKDPSKWKVLVENMKRQLSIAQDATEVDIVATILESAYLHLANTLTPSELEEVLDKEAEEGQKFHNICKRVELANTYAHMVISVSSEYLNHK